MSLRRFRFHEDDFDSSIRLALKLIYSFSNPINMNPVAIFLAQLLAPLYIVITVMILFRPNLFDEIMDNFKESPALIYLSGIITLVAGTAWLLAIFSFANFGEGLITIMGIMAAVKGASLLLLPKCLLKMTYKCPATKIIAGLIAGALGVYFLSLGYGLF